VTKTEDGEENLEIFEDNPSLSKEDENICILTITGNEKRKKVSQISVKKSKNNQNSSFEDEEKKGKKKRLKVEKEDSDYSDDHIEDDDEVSISATFYVRIFHTNFLTKPKRN